MEEQKAKQRVVFAAQDSNESERPVLNEKILKEKYSFNKLKSNNALVSAKNYCFKYYKPSPNCLASYLLKRVPFFKWIFTYDVKTNLLKDIIAGLTIGEF